MNKLTNPENGGCLMSNYETGDFVLCSGVYIPHENEPYYINDISLKDKMWVKIKSRVNLDEDIEAKEASSWMDFPPAYRVVYVNVFPHGVYCSFGEAFITEEEIDKNVDTSDIDMAKFAWVNMIEHLHDTMLFLDTLRVGALDD